jgi:hypothetical protein
MISLSLCMSCGIDAKSTLARRISTIRERSQLLGFSKEAIISAAPGAEPDRGLPFCDTDSVPPPHPLSELMNVESLDGCSAAKAEPVIDTA